MPSALLILGYGYLSAQDVESAETPSVETILELNMPILPESKVQGQPSAQRSNATYIYQIGADNTGTVITRGKNNELKLVQHGNANKASINLSGKNVVHNTLQNGNGNVFLEYGNVPNLNLERQILQNGNNQNVVIFGSNSLTESIRLNVQGDSQALTVRSFN